MKNGTCLARKKGICAIFSKGKKCLFVLDDMLYNDDRFYKSQVVRTQLDGIDVNQIDVLQKQVYDLQQDLKYLQQGGLPLYPSQGPTVDLWQRSLERIQ